MRLYAGSADSKHAIVVFFFFYLRLVAIFSKECSIGHFIEIISRQNEHGLLSRLVVLSCSELLILPFNDRSLTT